jgi:hypothetical protein
LRRRASSRWKTQLTDEEKKVLDEARSIRRKARGNNGAKRDIHEECEVEYKDVYPDDPFFDKLKAHPLEKMKGDGTPDYQTCTRYIYVPGHFKKALERALEEATERASERRFEEAAEGALDADGDAQGAPLHRHAHH